MRLIKLLALSVLLLFLIMLFAYGTYLGTGRNAWLAWQSERESKGDRFTWALLVPPPVADEDNFALAPIVAGAIKGKNLDPRFQALKLPEVPRTAQGNWREGRRADLQVYAKAVGSEDLLNALDCLAPALSELDRASRRKGSRIPVNYEVWEHEGLRGFRSATQVLRLRALVRLSRDNTSGALEDIQTCLRIQDHLKAEPSLLALLLRAAILGNLLQPVWEGIVDHRWNSSQLQDLQSWFGQIDLLQHSRLVWEAERLHGAGRLLAIVEERLESKFLTAEEREKAKRLIESHGMRATLYKGWVYRNVLEWSRFTTIEAIEVFPRGVQRVVPNAGTPEERQKKFERRHRDLILARIALPALLQQPVRMAFLQASVQHAMLACASERYRLEHGAYPDRLGDLVPAHLGNVLHDLITGAPLHYAKLPDGTFRLYSTGWDGKDDGGSLARTKDLPPDLDLACGDWPWFATAK